MRKRYPVRPALKSGRSMLSCKSIYISWKKVVDADEGCRRKSATEARLKSKKMMGSKKASRKGKAE
jgi:hypothetical protein